ncbi:MAG: hypothetical protein ACVCEJ_01100 [Candidatus Izemoplasmataceae bacterium]
MNKFKQEYRTLKNDYTVIELLKAILTGFVFYIFPTLLVIGVLIVLGTIYPYWNREILVIGSVLAFSYGIWTNKIIIETLNVYHEVTYKELTLFALLMQLMLLIAIIIIDIIVITTLF